MGVTGLWQILQPSARPIKIETLNRKRLAVDASIWIYQFLKAVRDKEGHALRNSHVVGFFRRICKLLFFGIKPVFVFDGGAPALKRQTISARKRRREGRRDDAVRTAGKLLAVQMQRRAEEEEQRRKDENGWRRREAEAEEVVPEEGLVYVDELQMSQAERQQNRTFRRKDAYHLPDLQVGLHEMGGPNDPRVMSLEELERYARQFETGEDVNVYDFSKIDYESPFFTSLPASDRYNILNAARLRSRLRMGHSKEQLDSMFPDRMAFSKFQIERVRERNELTTRLMNINDGDVKYAGSSTRVAGEKAREYVLVKNDGVEGGWALGVITGDEGLKQETAIDLDKPIPVAKEESEDEDDGFEDVPIEGLNRLPKRRKLDGGAEMGDGVGRQKSAFRGSQRPGARRKPKRAAGRPEDPESLFVADEPAEPEAEEEWEEVDDTNDLFGEDGEQPEGEDDELRQAIAMSLQQDGDTIQSMEDEQPPSDAEEDWYEVFHQRAAEEARPVPKGSARAIANILNKRAHGVAPESHETTSFGVPVPRPDDAAEDVEEDTMDLQAALAESRRGKRKVTPPPRRQLGTQPTGTPQAKRQKVDPRSTASPTKSGGFTGPLPFEQLDLGSSLLGKKKMQQRAEEAEGGFEKAGGLADQAEKEVRKREPLPPWFNGDLEEGMRKQEGLERADRERTREFWRRVRFGGGEEVLRRGEAGEVIDLEVEDEGRDQRREGGKEAGRQVIEIDDDDEDGGGVLMAPELTGVPVDNEIRMGDMADAVRAEPPVTDEMEHRDAQGKTSPARSKRPGPFELDEVDEAETQDAVMSEPSSTEQETTSTPAQSTRPAPFEMDRSDDEEPLNEAEERLANRPSSPEPGKALEGSGDEEEQLDWSDSEGGEAAAPTQRPLRDDARPAGGDRLPERPSRSPSMEFEDVTDKQPVQHVNGTQEAAERSPAPEFEDVRAVSPPARASGLPESPPSLPDEDDEESPGPTPVSGLAHQTSIPEDDDAEFDDFSDPEEEELLKALTLEAEEHARFASTLNQKSAAENIAEYEKELKQLRNQQKKDRRDADEVTHIMITECQQLLRLFGLPYVTAPMEAEAQCAELVRLGLVDGIVTDDSDCFLFGGTRVYKNMFNQAKFVECYLASDLEKEFGLTREKLIAVAELLGSDYTEGLPGVGPVTALEILGEFEGSLVQFREWWSNVQINVVTKEDDKGNAFRKKFRRNATKLFLPPSFPDPRIAKAYEEPEVDSDPHPFQWGVPDLDALRSFLMATIGWSQDTTDEVLVPVVRDMNRRADEGTQANITAFFDGGVGMGAAGVNNRGEAFAPRKRLDGSKRMGTALGRMAERAKVQKTLSQAGGGETRGVDMRAVEAVPEEVESGSDVAATNGLRKRKGGRRAAAAASEDGSEDGSEFEQPRKKSKRKTGVGRGGRGGRR